MENWDRLIGGEQMTGSQGWGVLGAGGIEHKEQNLWTWTTVW